MRAIYNEVVKNWHLELSIRAFALILNYVSDLMLHLYKTNKLIMVIMALVVDTGCGLPRHYYITRVYCTYNV